MRKDILAKAIRFADKSAVKPEKAVVVSPKAVKHTPEILSHRLYTRITPSEAKRLEARIWEMFPISALLRDLLIQYLDKKDHEHGKTKKK